MGVTEPATDRPFDHDPAGPTSVGTRRVIGLDVTRAVALIGVVVMNYHGYLNAGDDGIDRSWAERLFDPWQGVLSTRFAATFVLVAGMGVTLLTNRSVRSGDRSAIRRDRWRLVRRGAALYIGGYFLDKVWPGTILFFYGAYFVVAAGLFTLRSRWLIAIGACSALAAAAISHWSLVRLFDGHDTSWLDPSDPDSPSELFWRTFVGHTHPLFPWLAFFCAGMVLGRLVPRLGELRPRLILGGVGALLLTYGINALVSPSTSDMFEESDALLAHLLSTSPFDRGLLYTVGTLGSSVVAFCVISWLAERWPESPITVTFQRAGQLTLSLYLLHVLVFKLVVEQFGWVTPTGLDTALVFAVTFWIGAIAAAAWWQKLFGRGPVERLYRLVGG